MEKKILIKLFENKIYYSINRLCKGLSLPVFVDWCYSEVFEVGTQNAFGAGKQWLSGIWRNNLKIKWIPDFIHSRSFYNL